MLGFAALSPTYTRPSLREAGSLDSRWANDNALTPGRLGCILPAAFPTAMHRIAIATLLGFSALSSAPYARADKADPVQAALIARTGAAVPGDTIMLGLRLTHAPHWHTYWLNPGDSGLATRLRWQLPPGYTADEIAWPAPTRFDVGGLYNFGYEGDVVLPVTLHVAADAKPGTTVVVHADAAWLMCREECIPGKAALELTLPVRLQAGAAQADIAALFAQAEDARPRALETPAMARLDGDAVVVALDGKNLPRMQDLEVFAEERKLVAYAPPQVAPRDGGYVLRFSKSDYFTQAPAALHLVLVRRDGARTQAWRLTAPFAPPSP